MILLPLTNEEVGGLRDMVGPGSTWLLSIPAELDLNDESDTEAFVAELLAALQNPVPKGKP